MWGVVSAVYTTPRPAQNRRRSGRQPATKREVEVTTAAISQLLYLLDQAFDAQEWHSLLSNLHSVTLDDWRWIPPVGGRSISEMVGHVGGAKFMYENHAFGDATLTWDDPLIRGGDVLQTIPSAMDWLRAGQERLRRSIANLQDDDLLQPRRTNWGEFKETRWIIAVMIQHDLYHAGEINHLRALHQHRDNWPYSAESSG
jgi:hypothetical protein